MTITRRTFTTGSLAAPIFAQREPPPNILLVMADDLGYECLGCNGGLSYRTPNLDRFAASGVRFEHAYATPLCTPTRSQLMTGKYVHRNWRAFGVLDPAERTIGHMMRDAGYRTCIAGKWQLYSYNPPDYEPEWRGKGMKPEQSGFDEYCLWHTDHTELKGSRYGGPTIFANGRKLQGLEDRYGEDVFCDYMRDFISRNASRPFFAYYPMALTHDPFNPTPHSAQWKTGDRLENHTRFYKDMVEYMDYSFGRLMSHLDSLKLRRQTLVIFYSDNGTHWTVSSKTRDREVQGGKGKPTDASTHVPLIARWEGVTKPAVLQDLVDSTDFLPTIAEASGASTKQFGQLDGHSFLPQVLGRRAKPRDWTFLHYNPKPGWDKDRFSPARWARNQRFKLYDDGRLFDVPADPLEERPLPKDAERDVRRTLQSVLNQYAKH